MFASSQRVLELCCKPWFLSFYRRSYRGLNVAKTLAETFALENVEVQQQGYANVRKYIIEIRFLKRHPLKYFKPQMYKVLKRFCQCFPNELGVKVLCVF